MKVALRATFQSLLDGVMSGLGYGLGSLICGLFIEHYHSYTKLWHLFALVSLAGLCLQQLVELTRSRWSDTFEPKPGTRAHEIMQLRRADQSSASAKRPRQQ